MKGVYLFPPVEVGCLGPNSGIEKKVRAQYDVLKKYFNCELVILPEVTFSDSIFEKIIRRLPFTAGWRKWKYNNEFAIAEFIYIREPYYDYSFVKYLYKIKKSNNAVKILLEIPTYPPQPKKWTVRNFSYNIKDIFWCKISHRFIDVIINYYGYKMIDRIPCITTINGYDFNNIKIAALSKEDNEIDIISVAVNAYWHGYERVIKGLHLYYLHNGKMNYVYHLVGDPLPEYSELIKQYGLNDHVVLHGQLHGIELSSLYCKSMMGIDVLGGHRKNYPISSSLKSREYGAWGLPIITSSPVDYLDRNSKYQFIAPYDDSPLDFEAITNYFQALTESRNIIELKNEIRNNAEEHCNMNATMAPVIKWIKENCEDRGETSF